MGKLLRKHVILYYIINILRIREEERSKVQPRAVRKVIKEEICIIESNIN